MKKNSKKPILPQAFAHAQLVGDGYVMTFSYDSTGKQVELTMKGDPTAVISHLMKAFKGTGPLFNALADAIPKTDREIIREDLAERLQRRNPSLRENYRKTPSRNYRKTPGKSGVSASRHRKEPRK